MKSSKMENKLNFNPPTDEAKTLSPLTYYQPFQSSFDPDFSVPPPKTIVRQNLPQTKSRGQEAERTGSGAFLVSGGGIFHPWDRDDDGLDPRSSSQLFETSFRGASTLGCGKPEGHGPYGSTWPTHVPPRPSSSTRQEARASGRLGLHPQLFPKEDGGFGGGSRASLVFGSPDEASFRAGGSFGRSIGQAATFKETLSRSRCYLPPSGKNPVQNTYKTGHARPMVCNFCKNNKEVPDIYLNHYLHDPETKVLSCPVLRKHVCEICGGTGDQAHTLQYCPMNKERGLQSKVPVLLKSRTITNSTGKIRRN